MSEFQEGQSYKKKPCLKTSLPPSHPAKGKKETMVVHHHAGTQIFPNLKLFYKGVDIFYFIFDHLYVCIIYMCLVQE